MGKFTLLQIKCMECIKNSEIIVPAASSTKDTVNDNEVKSTTQITSF